MVIHIDYRNRTTEQAVSEWLAFLGTPLGQALGQS
jgi:hypothetical protein